MIAHFDIDCFFVSVERIKDSSLIGKPVIVGGNPDGRAIVSSASYEARSFGIYSGMALGRALKLCPRAVLIQGQFKDYNYYHNEVKQVVQSFSPIVQMSSIDEGYIDLQGTMRGWDNPRDVAESIMFSIKSKTGLSCSIGIAVNKLVAKIATNFAKPNGILYIKPGKEEQFLASLHIEDLPGVGKNTGNRLRKFGVKKVYNLVSIDRGFLYHSLGIMGGYLHDIARGTSGDSVNIQHICKSIGKETTFKEDTFDMFFIYASLHYLVEKVCWVLRRRGFKTKTVNIKFRYEDFETHIRSRTVKQPVDEDEIIYDVAVDLLRNSLLRRVGIRLIGVYLSNLIGVGLQLELFKSATKRRFNNMLSAVDCIRKKYGFNAILSGESIRLTM